MSMQADSTQMQIQKMLTTTPPAFSTSDAVNMASHRFGIEAHAKVLVSERDQNFRLTTASGERYTLKIANRAEQRQVIEFQNGALLHVAEQDASIPLPRVIPNLNRNFHCSIDINGETHLVRVLSWLDGEILADSESANGLAYRIGHLMARLGLALENYNHPGANPPLLWDMKRAAGLHTLLDDIDNPELRQLIGRNLDRFVRTAQPRLASLRTQVIHNDINRGNVLVNKNKPQEITGIIDFGDMVKSPLIIDLAVASAYQLNEDSDPLAGALPLIAGYHSTRPLQQEELSILLDLIRTRLITSLLIGNYRVKLFPENREYLTTSHDRARKSLTMLDSLSREKAFERINKYLRSMSV